MVRRHLPQSVPAPLCSATSSTLRAPLAMAASIALRVTTRHMQIYTGPCRLLDSL